MVFEISGIVFHIIQGMKKATEGMRPDRPAPSRENLASLVDRHPGAGLNHRFGGA
jgi:hypothetical protein